MGRADNRVKKYQEIVRKENIFKPWKNKNSCNFEQMIRDFKGQSKFANDLIKRRK